jgi:hypothetical protein
LIKEIQIPYPDESVVSRTQSLRQQAEEAKRRALLAADTARDELESALLLCSDASDTILAAFKPPK